MLTCDVVIVKVPSWLFFLIIYGFIVINKSENTLCLLLESFNVIFILSSIITEEH